MEKFNGSFQKKYNFGGSFKCSKDFIQEECTEEFDVFDIEDVYITKVIYQNPATIVFWSDGTKTVSKCHANDVYSKETGLAICVLKKIVGSTKVHDLFEDWILDSTENDKNNIVNISKIRKKHKFCKKCKEEVCRNSAIKIELK